MEPLVGLLYNAIDINATYVDQLESLDVENKENMKKWATTQSDADIKNTSLSILKVPVILFLTQYRVTKSTGWRPRKIHDRKFILRTIISRRKYYSDLFSVKSRVRAL